MIDDVNYYNIERNNKYGRYLTAHKDLVSGELIFKDKPFAIGPKPDTPPLCLGCYCPVENKVCSQCKWPICSDVCERSELHMPECKVFSACKVRYQPLDDWTASSPQLDCITPLRVLLAKEKQPERWKSEVSVMEDHSLERQQRPTWNADQVNIANFLIDYCKLRNRFDKELVQKVCGILEVNSVEVPSRGGFSIRALYPRLAIAAHSCVPNIVHTITQNDYQVHVRAAVPIKTNDTLHLCYTYALSSTIFRREFLKQSKFFLCDCPRCADPTELGTHLSTIKCRRCDNGYVLSTNPLNDEAPWTCRGNGCEFKYSSNEIRDTLGVIQADIDQLDALEPGPAAIEQIEAIISKYENLLHPQHSFLLSMKHSLTQLYGRVEGYNVFKLSEPMLQRKIDMCRMILKLLDVITPGETRMRGMMLYDLHAPLMIMARNILEHGVINKDKYKEKLREPLQCLTEAARILTREDPQSPEGITAQILQQRIKQLELERL